MNPTIDVLMLLGNDIYPEDTRVAREAQTLVAAGYRVTVISPRARGQARREEIAGVHVRRYRLPELGRGATKFVVEHVYAVLASLVMSIRVRLDTGVDVIHLHNPPDLLVLVALPHKLLGTRVIYDHHDLAPEMYRARFTHSSRVLYFLLTMFERLSCRFADHVIETNESYAAVDRARSGVPPERITIVRNGPDLDRLRPVPPDAALREDASTVICYVGVMGPQDGVDHLLWALHHLVHEGGHPHTRCLIVGNGDALPTLRRLTAELGLEENVRFIGRVPTSEVARYICAADICVEPAPTNPYNDRSTMIKIMEYLALAKPVVAFDLPENRVTAGSSAVYVPPNDDAAFGKALAMLAEDPEYRQRLGASGRRRVEERLAWQHIAPRLTEAYRITLTEVG